MGPCAGGMPRPPSRVSKCDIVHCLRFRPRQYAQYELLHSVLLDNVSDLKATPRGLHRNDKRKIPKKMNRCPSRIAFVLEQFTAVGMTATEEVHERVRMCTDDAYYREWCEKGTRVVFASRWRGRPVSSRRTKRREVTGKSAGNPSKHRGHIKSKRHTPTSRSGTHCPGDAI